MIWLVLIDSVTSAIKTLCAGIAANAVYDYIRAKLNDRRK